MSMENSKVMGEVGALLMLVSPLAGAYTAILGLVGFVLLIVALDGLADHYRERGIFKNALNGGLVLIAGAAIAAVVMVAAGIGMLSVLGIPVSSWADPAAWQAVDWEGFTEWAAMAPFIGVMVGALVVLFALSVYAAALIRRSLNALAHRSGVAMFATSGTLLFVGAILTIVVVGVVLLWISLLLLAVAFFKLSAEPAQAPPMASV
jgi:uncharacterized membrane protein